MRTLIIDLGHSFTKCFIHSEKESLFYQVKTPNTITGMLRVLRQQLLKTEGYLHYIAHEGSHNRMLPIDRVMVISFSDAVFYEKTDGSFHQLDYIHSVPAHPECPPYQVTGKPTNSTLNSIANYLLHLRDTVGLKNIKRILPPSAFIIAQLAGNPDWNTWDITHASNSGMWDYKKERWHETMQPFFEAGVIAEKVLACRAVVFEFPSGVKYLLGGHDSTFVNANDVPYSTKPYLSLGTWTTASAESPFRKRDRHHPSRFVIAPNGTILHQLCIQSSKHSLQQGIKFLERKQLSVPVKVFGGWAKEVMPQLKSDTVFFECVDFTEHSFLHEQASIYAHGTHHRSDYRECLHAL